MKLTNFVNKDNMCTFEYIRAGYAYYSVFNRDNEETYIFPVPINDMGEATFNATERSIFMLRYIRKAVEDGMMVFKHPMEPVAPTPILQRNLLRE